MTKHTPLFASERTAANLLDMTPAEFLALVDQGALPRPSTIGPHKRWSVSSLQAIAAGKAAIPDQDIE